MIASSLIIEDMKSLSHLIKIGQGLDGVVVEVLVAVVLSDGVADLVVQVLLDILVLGQEVADH